MSSPNLRVVYSHGEDGYIVAECPQLPGCMSQGKTREEASKNIADAITSVLMARVLHFTHASDACVSHASDDEDTFRVQAPDLVLV
jgi:predicted RNase H-like HicB family nuclease